MGPRIVVSYAEVEEVKPQPMLKAADMSKPFVVRKGKRITPEEAEDIRKLLAYADDGDLSEIAKAFQVSVATIRRIKKRKTA